MKNPVVLLFLLMLAAALRQPAAARQLPTHPTPATLAAQRQVAINQVRPLINLLHLHDQQALRVEQLLLDHSLTSRPLPEQVRALQPVLTSAQLTRWQQAQQKQVASLR